jgi:Na+/H+-dicarboxylate symporter
MRPASHGPRLIACAGFEDRLEFGRVKTLLRSLYFQVLLAIALGVLVGALCPQIGAAMKPFGDAFIKLIKMLIAPVIF